MIITKNVSNYGEDVYFVFNMIVMLIFIFGRWLYDDATNEPYGRTTHAGYAEYVPFVIMY